MKYLKKCLLLGLFCGVAWGCGQNNPPASTNKSTTKDQTTVTTNRPITPESSEKNSDTMDRTNTGVNVRDRDSTSKTPMDQKENKPDLTTTAEIRKQVVDGKMSVKSQNIKIITQDGKVTLRGPVANNDEKQRIEKIAKDVAGAANVDNQLEVDEK